MIIRNELESTHLESDCIQRDKMSHETQVSQLECDNQTAAQKDSIFTRYGVNHRCIFTILEYFDATKCFMHDLMHVSNEGFLNSEISYLLKYLISHLIIRLDLDIGNYKILTLKSSREFTIPPLIRKNEVSEFKKLSFTSLEISSLAMCPALVLGEFVSDDDVHYANFLLLL